MYLPRSLEKEILNLWGKGNLILLRGPRRSGKTTLLKHLQKIKGGTYITFEDPAMVEAFLHAPVDFVNAYGFPIYLDEIQYLGEKGAQALKLIYDTLDTFGQIIISGSGAFDIKTKILAYLVGRVYVLTLLPLNFEEITTWKGLHYALLYEKGNARFQGLLKGEEKLPEPSKALWQLFNEFSIWGGYPEIVLTKDKDRLSSLVTTTIEEDIVRYFSLRQGKKLWNTIKRLAAITGGLLDYTNLGLSYNTAQEYLYILERSFIIKTLPPFSTNKLVELSKREKVYFYDSGFRNNLLGIYSPLISRPDAGQTLESIIFAQLLKYGEVHYWRTKNKAEVDFVLVQNGRPIPIEVKLKGRITPSLLSFIRRYHPPVAFVAGTEVFERRVNDTMVFGVPFYYL